jgi:hypothetical protein
MLAIDPRANIVDRQRLRMHGLSVTFERSAKAGPIVTINPTDSIGSVTGFDDGDDAILGN